MLNVKRHVRVSGPLQGSQNHSVYMRRAEATRAEKTPLGPSLDFSVPGPQNRVSHTPPQVGKTSAPGRRQRICFRVANETDVPPRPNQSPPNAQGARLGHY